MYVAPSAFAVSTSTVILFVVFDTVKFLILGPSTFPICSICISSTLSLLGTNVILNIYPDVVVTSYVPSPLSITSVSLFPIIPSVSILSK